jgi:hypothetical protein
MQLHTKGIDMDTKTLLRLKKSMQQGLEHAKKEPMEIYDITVLKCELLDRFEDNKKEVLAGLDSPYWDNEEYQWYVSQLDHTHRLDDEDCITVLISMGYDKKLVNKTYGVKL